MRKTSKCDHESKASTEIYRCDLHGTPVVLMACLRCDTFELCYSTANPNGCFGCAMAAKFGHGVQELLQRQFTIADLASYVSFRRSNRRGTGKTHDGRSLRALRIAREFDDAVASMVDAMQPPATQNGVRH